MKSKTLISGMAVLSLLNIMASCGTNASSPDTVEEDGQSLLWRIEGNGLNKPSYIFGTMHVIPADQFRLGHRLVELAALSDQIVMEMDMDDIKPLSFASDMLMPGGTSLKDVMEPDDYALVKSVIVDSLDTSPIEWLAYTKTKPIFVIAGIVKGMMGKTKEYETELMDIAKENKVEILGLETVEEQLAFIDTIPIEAQVEMLLEGVRGRDTMKLYLDRMISFYYAEQLDSIESMMHDSVYSELMEFEGPLITDRNVRWVAQIADFMKEGQTLFAVGAAHLPGEAGVLNLLRKAGYTITPISTE